MRMLVVGAGSTGGYFGGRLLEAGRDVTFLVRQQRKARLQADGLRIVSPFGDATLHPPLVTAKEIDGPFDVVLLTVKAYSLDEALADFAPAVGDGTMILPVLNGMRHMDRLTERFGDDAVVGCTCHSASSIDEEGRIVQHNKVQEMAYGELDVLKGEIALAQRDSATALAAFNAAHATGATARTFFGIARAQAMAIDAWQTYDRLGSPEGDLALAQLAIYLASTAKSNAGYVAFGAARADVREHGTLDVPLHLRNAPTKLMKSLGYGRDYQYDHDAEGGIALDQTGFPDAMGERVYYAPVERGLEIRLKEKLDALRAARERARSERD